MYAHTALLNAQLGHDVQEQIKLHVVHAILLLAMLVMGIIMMIALLAIMEELLQGVLLEETVQQDLQLLYALLALQGIYLQMVYV